MNLTKGQKEKMQALEEAILLFEQSKRNAEDYEYFMYKVLPTCEQVNIRSLTL